MTESAFFWLLLNFVTIVILAFYSMLEMACVSFNKVRLQYYVSKGNLRATWLNYLLHNPSRLFGTTLIAVNVATVAGSEFSREFHSAIGVDPDLSPLTQVFIVVIFGELAPMFAARRYAENVVMLGIPLIYASAKMMAPLLWALGLISKLCNLIIGGKEPQGNIFLSLEELQKVLEELGEDRPSGIESDDFNMVTRNIFNLRLKNAQQVMEPINPSAMASANATAGQLREILKKSDTEYIPVYSKEITNIIGIIHPRDLIRASDNHKIREYATPPWFVTQTTGVMEILKQFRKNNERTAVILDNKGKAVGIILFEDIVEEIFGKTLPPVRPIKTKRHFIIEKTFSGDMKVSEFNSQYGIILDKRSDLTLSEIMTNLLGHHPLVGESILIYPFELTVKETALLGIKSIEIKTKIT